MQTGTRLGPFVLTAPLGRGGMGEVWLATDEARGGPAAVKLVSGADPRGLLNEVAAVARLDHPNVVQVLDQGRLGDHTWLAMELASSTAQAVPGTWSEVRALLRQVLAGLAHAHARGVVHCDIKPSNTLGFDGGRWALADFGIARTERQDARNARAGTPVYMAPEQHRGGRLPGRGRALARPRSHPRRGRPAARSAAHPRGDVPGVARWDRGRSATTERWARGPPGSTGAIGPRRLARRTEPGSCRVRCGAGVSRWDTLRAPEDR